MSARALALDVLDQVLGQDRPLEETFAGLGEHHELAPRDRAFARLLTTTTLRRLGQIDALLGRFVKSPPKVLRVRNLLRLGVAQLLFLKTPAHAAVGETVGLARGPAGFARGLVNAVLRRAAREGEGLLARQDAARLNLPDWLWRSWCAAYGEDRTRAIATAQLAEPPLDLTIKTNPGDWAARLEGRRLGHATVRRTVGGAIEDLPGYRDGAWWVQDAAAALPARLFGDLAGRQVLDLCAAPGGKTAQLAAAGARVTAVEVSEARAGRLRANLTRLRLEAEVVVADALDWAPPAPADCVLLDAPCTATGTIRRHPDVAWHKRPSDVGKMAELQARLLRAATAMLAPDGRLVYASCSLQLEEGVSVVDRVVGAGSLVRAPIAADELRGLAVDVTDAGDVRTLPCHLPDTGGLDGFFIAHLRRA